MLKINNVKYGDIKTEISFRRKPYKCPETAYIIAVKGNDYYSLKKICEKKIG